ncbi:acyltransferase family protein [Aerosakkonemataceae cyanobacterium BLCC-F50]|uniref:Acyltransferase family protein n=1 Tax=Floridaenema flaviceps BLCC-F50 TaxID=3153642 RepID=A0ABV4XRV5_9CYAN
MATPPANLQKLQKASESLTDKEAKKSNKNIEGFDFLRAIFSIAIVALKSNLFVVVEILFSGAFAYALMAKVAYLAVPIFFQISLFLLYFKSEKTSNLYLLKKRLPKLILLYGFWVGAKVLYDVFIKGNFSLINDVTSSPRRLVEFIVTGGQSPFFFLFGLIFLSSLAGIIIASFRKIRSNSVKLFISYGLLFVSCLLIFSLSVTQIVVGNLGGNAEAGIVRSISNFAFWDYNPLCFLPYLFTALIVTQEFNEGKLKNWSSSLKLKLCVLLASFIFFLILELHLFEKLLHYSRLSLVFGSWLLLYLALLSPLKAPPAIKFLSSCSLGIYGFHVFFTDIVLSTIENNKFIKNIFQTVSGLEIAIGFVVVLACSIALTLLFKRIKGLRDFV